MPSNLRRLLWSKDVPLVWCIFIPTALTIGLTWLLVYYLSGDRIEILGETVIPDHGTFQLGQTSDVESGYNLWAKTENFEWVNIGWSLNGGKNSFAAASKSGKFHGIVAEGISDNDRNGLHDIPIVVIFDSTKGVFWPSHKSKDEPLDFWIKAWREIKENEPRFPTPPIPKANEYLQQGP